MNKWISTETWVHLWRVAYLLIQVISRGYHHYYIIGQSWNERLTNLPGLYTQWAIFYL